MVPGMIRRCHERDVETIWSIINEAATAYKGVIPADRWKEPYMSRDELQREIDEDVAFWGYEVEGDLIGVMGVQHVAEVTLVRHAYVLPTRQGEGIGGRLLSRLRAQTDLPILIGTWADAVWAVRFYEGHGFRLVSDEEEKKRLLRRFGRSPSDRLIPLWFWLTEYGSSARGLSVGGMHSG